jgi:hypothetical protein
MKEKKQLYNPTSKIKFENSDKSEKNSTDSFDKKLFLWRIIINAIFSIILIVAFCLVWTSITPAWKIFFLLTIWSFWANTFYIIAITIIDILLYKGHTNYEKCNNFIRNDLIRIILPFSISTIVIYWELVLLGENYQSIENSVLDYCKSFFIHGLVLAFMCFDIFTVKHINKKSLCKRDILIISIIMAVHLALVIFCKEVLNEFPYDFLMIADKRQVIASCIILYVLVLNGYIAFYLISEHCFEKEEIDNDDDNYIQDDDSGDKLKINEDNDEQIYPDSDKKLNLPSNKDNKDENTDNINNNINNEEIEDKRSVEEEKKEDNENNINEESEKYKISEKEDNKIDIFEKKMDDYAIDFIRKNSLNEISKNKANKELLNLKKKQFGITDIKIPKNNFVFEQNKK